MKTSFRLFRCALLLALSPALALASGDFLSKILPPLPPKDQNQVAGIIYVYDVDGQVEAVNPETGRISDLKKGDALPDLPGLGVAGKIPAMKGSVVWLDFWASWCGPCAMSFPAMDRIYRKYKDRGLIVLGVNVDEEMTNMILFQRAYQASAQVVTTVNSLLGTTLAMKV